MTEGVEHLDPAEVQTMGDDLSADADSLRLSAGGVNRNVPVFPKDAFGLAQMIVHLDEAREGFHQRVAEVLDAAGDKAILQVLDTTKNDGLPFQPLPRSAL